MANANITPGAGFIVQTDVVTADSSNVQGVQPVKVVAGVLTRTPLPILGTAGAASADVVSTQGIAGGTPTPISAASLPLPTGAATAANQPPLGAALSAASLPVVLATDGVTIGATNETAPVGDTNASGLNGRLQRIAQRLTRIIALLPAALGGGGGLKTEGVGTAGTPAGGVVTVQGSIPPSETLPSVVIAGKTLAGTQGQIPVVAPLVDGYPTSANGMMTLAAGYAFNGSTLDKIRTVAVIKSAVATAAGNTAVWTPTAGKKFRLQRFMLVLTDEAARAAAGDTTVKFQDAAVDIGIGLPVYVPAAAIAAPIGAAWSSGWIDLGNGYLSAAINQVLNVNLSAALTAGTFGVVVAGTEE